MKLTHFLHMWTIDVTCTVGVHAHMGIEGETNQMPSSIASHLNF